MRARQLVESLVEPTQGERDFAKALGFDIVDGKFLGRRYEAKKHECPKCGGKNATIREAHADTGMDCTELRCPDCGHSEER